MPPWTGSKCGCCRPPLTNCCRWTIRPDSWPSLWMRWIGRPGRRSIEGDPLGAPAYHAGAERVVTNVRSCRKLEAACRDQIPYLWLTGWQHPDHNTLWRLPGAPSRHGEPAHGSDGGVPGVGGPGDAGGGRNEDGRQRGGEMVHRRALHQLLVGWRNPLPLGGPAEGGEDGDPVHLPEKLSDRKVA